MDGSIHITSESVFSAITLGDDNWSLNALPVTTGEAQWIPPNAEFAHVIAKSFSKVPQVVAVLVEFGDECTSIWTLLSAYDRAAREKVYEKELEVCERFAVFGLDFKATSAELVSAQELRQDGLVQIFKR